MLKTIFIGLIRFYQLIISPLKPPTCRFYPTCSHYGLESVKRFGGLKGGFLAVKRILKCQPFPSRRVRPCTGKMAWVDSKRRCTLSNQCHLL